MWRRKTNPPTLKVRVSHEVTRLEKQCMADAFERLLKFKSDVPAKFTAPPSGLFLEKVLYKGDKPVLERSAIISVK